MTDREPPDDFDARLAKALAGRQKPVRSQANQDGALGFGMRVGIEVVTALTVGVGIGYLLDRWLGTKPWLMILFFFLGSAAGVLNVYRMVRGFGYRTGYRLPDEAGSDEIDKD